MNPNLVKELMYKHCEDGAKMIRIYPNPKAFQTPSERNFNLWFTVMLWYVVVKLLVAPNCSSFHREYEYPQLQIAPYVNTFYKCTNFQ